VRDRRITVRTAGVSFRLDLRVLAALATCAAVALAVLTVHVARGEFHIPFGDVLATLAGAGDRATTFIVYDLRLPRALAALLAGASLGIAGAIFQDLARNPLVSPDIVGITFGASLAAVSVLVFSGAGGTVSGSAAALGGALGAGVLLYALAWRGGMHGYRLVLVGVGLTAVLQAGISYVLTRGEILNVHEAWIWMVGSLNGVGWIQVWPQVAVLAVLLPAALLLARALEAMQLGDEVAVALGVRLEPARLALAAIAVVLTASAVAAVGPIAFVAFIAPHVARATARTLAPSGVIPVSAATGAVVVLAGDAAGRLLLAPTEIPVGIVTAIIAAPYFLLLLQRANRMGTSG
jgi:iron complex transport system permease protein